MLRLAQQLILMLCAFCFFARHCLYIYICIRSPRGSPAPRIFIASNTNFPVDCTPQLRRTLFKGNCTAPGLMVVILLRFLVAATGRNCERAARWSWRGEEERARRCSFVPIKKLRDRVPRTSRRPRCR